MRVRELGWTKNCFLVSVSGITLEQVNLGGSLNQLGLCLITFRSQITLHTVDDAVITTVEAV